MQTLATASAVLAYFDPGSGSLLLQAIVGGTAGLLVFGNYLWTMVKNRVLGRKPASEPSNL